MILAKQIHLEHYPATRIRLNVPNGPTDPGIPPRIFWGPFPGTVRVVDGFVPSPIWLRWPCPFCSAADPAVDRFDSEIDVCSTSTSNPNIRLSSAFSFSRRANSHSRSSAHSLAVKVAVSSRSSPLSGVSSPSSARSALRRFLPSVEIEDEKAIFVSKSSVSCSASFARSPASYFRISSSSCSWISCYPIQRKRSGTDCWEPATSTEFTYSPFPERCHQRLERLLILLYQQVQLLVVVLQGLVLCCDRVRHPIKFRIIVLCFDEK